MLSKIIILSLKVHILKDNFITVFSQVYLSTRVGDHITLSGKVLYVHIIK